MAKPVLRLNPELLERWGISCSDLASNEKVRRCYTYDPEPLKSEKYFAEVVYPSKVDGKRVRALVKVKPGKARWLIKLKTNVRGYLKLHYSASRTLDKEWLARTLSSVAHATPSYQTDRQYWKNMLERIKREMRLSVESRMTKVSYRTIRKTLKAITPRDTCYDIIRIHPFTLAVENSNPGKPIPKPLRTRGYIFLKTPCPLSTPEEVADFLEDPAQLRNSEAAEIVQEFRKTCESRKGFRQPVKECRKTIEALKKVPVTLVVMPAEFLYYNEDHAQWREATYDARGDSWMIHEWLYKNQVRAIPVSVDEPVYCKPPAQVHVSSIHAYLLYITACTNIGRLPEEVVKDVFAKVHDIPTPISKLLARFMYGQMNSWATAYLLTGHPTFLNHLKESVANMDMDDAKDAFSRSTLNLLSRQLRPLEAHPVIGKRFHDLKAVLTPVALARGENVNDDFWEVDDMIHMYRDNPPRIAREVMSRFMGAAQP